MEIALHVGMFVSRRGKRIRRIFGDKLVEIYLQFGYGMMEHCRSLFSKWEAGTAILSPRDLNPEQLVRLSLPH